MFRVLLDAMLSADRCARWYRSHGMHVYADFRQRQFEKFRERLIVQHHYTLGRAQRAEAALAKFDKGDDQ